VKFYAIHALPSGLPAGCEVRLESAKAVARVLFPGGGYYIDQVIVPVELETVRRLLGGMTCETERTRHTTIELHNCVKED
jgi:hypothetical protein